jgi:hypothetical protein
MGTLSVKINDSKSIYSDTGNVRVEFAKRLFYNGTEITGLKMDLLKAASCKISLIIDMLRVAKMRSWDLNGNQFRIPSLLSDKGRELLQVLLFDYTDGVSPLTGVDNS